jgi:spermidine/putrescine transport system permease protein
MDPRLRGDDGWWCRAVVSVVGPERRAARIEARRGGALVLPALLWTVAFFLLPLFVVAAYSLFRRTGGRLDTTPSLDNYGRFLGDPSFRGALWSSLEVTGLTIAVSLTLAYPLAYILANRVPPRWQRLALILAVLPFWTSYVVRSYSWLLVLAPNGVVNQALMLLGLTSQPLRLAYNQGATVLGFVHFFTMLTTLTIYASLRRIDPRWRLAAADLGAGAVQTFLRVTLPLSLPGVMVGAFLTFVIAIGDYVTPQILGGNRELVLPQAILLQIGRRNDLPLASAMALVMMVVVGLAYLACARWMRGERN